MLEKKFIIANWKMNCSKNFIHNYTHNFNGNLDKYNFIICPPFPYLLDSRNKFDEKIQIAAQDVSSFEDGAYTSQVSAKMLIDLKCEYVIIGHNETRLHSKYNNEEIKNKIIRAIENNLKIIYCIGENEDIRREGFYGYSKFLAQQLDISNINITKENFIIAYEPIWAIGNGNSASIENITEVAEFIKSHVKKLKNIEINVLYGGSVNLSNSNEILSIPLISGLLIGGMSLKIDDINKL